MFVYMIVNDVNWKIYVGKTTRPNLRHYLQKKFWVADHCPHLKSHLYAAIRQYGKEHFHIHSLISDLKTNEELCHWEQTLIKALAAQNPEIGYNICRGGEGFTGPHTEETRKKISKASEDMWKDPIIRHTIIAKNLGKKRLPNVGETTRRYRLGTKASVDTVKRLQESHTGLKRSEESRARQGQSISGTKNHFYGKAHSETSRAKMREKRLQFLSRKSLDTQTSQPVI
jgi:group I intron endonuclease